MFGHHKVLERSSMSSMEREARDYAFDWFGIIILNIILGEEQKTIYLDRTKRLIGRVLSRYARHII